MSKDLSVNKTKFIFEWALVNLAGWIIFEFVLSFVSPFIEPDTRKDTFFIGITIIGLLLGASIGIMQWIWLNTKKQYIRPFWWILETACGWGSWGVMFFFWNLLDFALAYSIIFLILTGCIIGLVQAIILGKSIGTSIFWIVANVLGMFIFGLSTYSAFVLPLIYQSFFLNILNSIYAHFHFYLPPKALYLLILPVVMPILGALTTALPTGFVIYKKFDA